MDVTFTLTKQQYIEFFGLLSQLWESQENLSAFLEEKMNMLCNQIIKEILAKFLRKEITIRKSKKKSFTVKLRQSEAYALIIIYQTGYITNVYRDIILQTISNAHNEQMVNSQLHLADIYGSIE